jgi:hypothetical protein
MPISEDDFVDVNHPYYTDNDLDANFSWDFDKEFAVGFASELVSNIISHTLQCADENGPEHVLADYAVQAGLVLADIPEGTQVPVLMLDDGNGLSPIAVLLTEPEETARIPLAHTLGTLITEDGIYPALPSKPRKDFGLTGEDE